MTHPLEAALRKSNAASVAKTPAIPAGVLMEVREVVLKSRALELALTGHEHADTLHDADIAVLKDLANSLMGAVFDLQREVEGPKPD